MHNFCCWFIVIILVISVSLLPFSILNTTSLVLAIVAAILHKSYQPFSIKWSMSGCGFGFSCSEVPTSSQGVCIEATFN